MTRYICFTKLKHLIFINGGSNNVFTSLIEIAYRLRNQGQILTRVHLWDEWSMKKSSNILLCRRVGGDMA
jgi:hypothetical protein